MNAILDVDTSFHLDIVNIYAGRSWPTIELTKFADDEVTLEDFPTGDYRMEVFTDLQKRNQVMSIPEDSGLLVVDNEITINRTIAENTLTPGVYYFRIVCDISSDASQQVAHGSIKVNP